MNYYTIFDLNTTAISIAFADAKYTQRSGMNLGSIVFVLILTILVLLSFLGCFLIFKQYKVAQELQSEKNEEIKKMLSPRSRRILGFESFSGSMVSEH
mmetsp:Transcript_22749/g.17180  ORF Transcript_22749/g.17180 Transcript_22749/m.17180 type:complete len:98 (+) Transcript_22749:1070-1363(+)